jgi:glycerol-3-phosphate dehydrogenase
MNRDDMRARLRDAKEPWDLLVVGGGATGLGCAVDAASRGLRVALVEQSDFARATSSRSTKLLHGGVRYLRGGQVSLVAQSLREREIARHNAATLVHDLPFLVPAYRPLERMYYAAGLGIYDWLSRRGGATGGRTRAVSRAQALALAPTLRAAGLRGGVVYHDLQFNDARFALQLARTAADAGAVLMNYARVESFTGAGRIRGAVVRDLETGESFEVTARAVINAGGIFADAVRQLWRPGSAPLLRLSRGTHVVLDRAFLPGGTAVLIPRTDDGRVVFLIPWRGRLLAGTTEADVAAPDIEPPATLEEIDFLLEHAGRYLERAPARADVRSAFAGLRPLPAASGASSTLRRDHHLALEDGMVTITGGKWTTYRLMAQDAVDAGTRAGGLAAGSSGTRTLAVSDAGVEAADRLEARILAGEVASRPDAGDTTAIERMAREEMAVHAGDVLARRTRALFLDARSAAAAARAVAAAMARALGHDDGWVEREVAEFTALARGWLPDGAKDR